MPKDAAARTNGTKLQSSFLHSNMRNRGDGSLKVPFISRPCVSFACPRAQSARNRTLARAKASPAQVLRTRSRQHSKSSEVSKRASSVGETLKHAEAGRAMQDTVFFLPSSFMINVVNLGPRADVLHRLLHRPDRRSSRGGRIRIIVKRSYGPRQSPRQ